MFHVFMLELVDWVEVEIFKDYILTLNIFAFLPEL